MFVFIEIDSSRKKENANGVNALCKKQVVVNLPGR